MDKVSGYKIAISEYLCCGDFKGLSEFLSANSNLPGPRGNLEMAYAFGDCFDCGEKDGFWEFLMELSSIDSEQAPTGDPDEILPFCAALAAGSMYEHVKDAKKARIRNLLRAAMNDKRWRMREGAAMGLQRIAEKDFGALREIFDTLYPESNFIEKRAMVAALAHPPILKDKDNASYSLKVSESIMDEAAALSGSELGCEDFKVLSKGLKYALSVFVEHLPEEGFKMLRRFSKLPQKHIKRIIRSNLGKARLRKKFLQETQEVMRIVDEQ